MKQKPEIRFVTLLLMVFVMTIASVACLNSEQPASQLSAITTVPTATTQLIAAVDDATATATTKPQPSPTAEPTQVLATDTPINTATADSVPVELSVEPQTAPATVPVTIRVVNLEPGQSVVLKSRASDRQGREWKASGVWIADDSGRVDLSQQAPEEGSYSGVNGMGLFWSMLPTFDADNPSFFNSAASYSVEISAEINQQTIATTIVTRESIPSNVLHRELHGDGLRGVFYYPAAEGPHPGLLLLGGSEGGFNRLGAAAWASQGYATLALAYFGAASMPNQLSEIPLETFSQGLAWLKAQPEVDPERIAISGTSRGSEAAMLTAIEHPEIDAVIAIVPSSMVWYGLDLSGGPKSAWTRDGIPLPFVSFPPSPPSSEAAEALSQPLVAFTPLFEFLMEDAPADAIIPVEQIEAPILLISGTLFEWDQLWPSSKFANLIVERLEANSFAHPYENVVVADSGHLMRIDHMPPHYALDGMIMGGAREANASGGVQSWQAQVEFLNTYLGRR